MKKDELQWGDWQRILFGEGGPGFLLEVVVRVAFVYLLILVAMRLMGKRMTAQVSRSELVARVSLAAAVGLPIQRPNRGLLAPAIIAVIIVLIGRLLAHWAARNRKFEKAFQGFDNTLVSDGVLHLSTMTEVRVTHERLFAELRSKGIRHLGQVKRLYMEADGDFSVVKMEEEIPGLSIIPEWDTDMCQRQQQTNVQLCKQCGSSWNEQANDCDECHNGKPEKAILLPKEKE